MLESWSLFYISLETTNKSLFITCLGCDISVLRFPTISPQPSDTGNTSINSGMWDEGLLLQLRVNECFQISKVVSKPIFDIYIISFWAFPQIVSGVEGWDAMTIARLLSHCLLLHPHCSLTSLRGQLPFVSCWNPQTQRKVYLHPPTRPQQQRIRRFWHDLC